MKRDKHQHQHISQWVDRWGRSTRRSSVCNVTEPQFVFYGAQARGTDSNRRSSQENAFNTTKTPRSESRTEWYSNELRLQRLWCSRKMSFGRSQRFQQSDLITCLQEAQKSPEKHNCVYRLNRWKYTADITVWNTDSGPWHHLPSTNTAVGVEQLIICLTVRCWRKGTVLALCFTSLLQILLWLCLDGVLGLQRGRCVARCVKWSSCEYLFR